MARDNREEHSQPESPLSKMVEMVGKKSGLPMPKSTMAWVAAIAFLGYVRSQFVAMDEYIQKVASTAPAIVSFQSQVGTNFNDLGKELVVIKYRLDVCTESAKEVQTIKETLATLRSKK